MTKYRHHILDKLDILKTMKEVESQSDFVILEQEFEPDHLHMMIKHTPKYSPTSFIRRIKMMTTELV